MKTNSNGGRIRAVLGPTNTGKTRFAIERMLAHSSGVIGLPLRLLAREVYDNVREKCGPSSVALITGEERIYPERTRYRVCTVEAMPETNDADFLCVDEIQLCGDRERGHVFTDRLLRARGQVETLFLGSDTMRPTISQLVDNVSFEHWDRLSTLSFTGSRKISRMRPRSAFVAFSVEEVYAVAEIVRRQRGGAAVVMGALSPRTRNAQVGLYQNGDVDFLVATDAIGMGLNLNIDHVAFVGLTKFDGNRIRRLAPNEIAQIAGRAGRFKSPGTFGTTADAESIESETAAAIEENRFRNLGALQWRNSDLDFRSASTLLDSLRQASDNPLLTRAREAEDVAVLRELSGVGDIRQRLQSPRNVQLLWAACQIPNFLKSSLGEHAQLVKTVFTYIRDRGFVPDEWLETQVRRIDRVDGEVDALARRIAGIRIWTYVSQRPDWVENSTYWRERTRAIEDRISDALHAGLTKRFVDRRTSVLLKRMKQKEALVTTVNPKGEVEVEGEHVGRIEGFRFVQAAASTPEEERAIRAASLKVLAPEYSLRASRLYNAPNAEFDLTEQGGLMWGEHSVGKLVPGKSVLSPDIEVFVDEQAGDNVRERVERRLRAFVEQKLAAGCEALRNLTADEEITGLARGIAYRLAESFGVVPRSEVAADVKELDQDHRKLLRRHGVRFGQRTLYVQPVLKPEATRWRIVLWSLSQGFPEFPPPPPPGLVTIPHDPGLPSGYYPLSGYDAVGSVAVRIDMLERLLNLLRTEDSRKGFEATAEMLSITGTSLDGFSKLMQGLGYRATEFMRPKVRGPSGFEKPEEGKDGSEADGAGGESPPEAGQVEEQPAGQGESREAEIGADEVTPEPVQTSPSPADEDSAEEQEMVLAFRFTWQTRRQSRSRTGEEKTDRPVRRRERGKRPRRDRPDSKPKAAGKPDRKRQARPVSREANERRVDPDNPFSVLAQLKDKL